MPIHIEFLLEELSMEAFLQARMPGFLPADWRGLRRSQEPP